MRSFRQSEKKNSREKIVIQLKKTMLYGTKRDAQLKHLLHTKPQFLYYIAVGFVRHFA